MAKNEIVIDNFQKGIAQSPFVGFEEIRCLDIFDKPGVAYPNRVLSKESSTTVSDLIEGTCTNGNTMYAYTNENERKVYKRSSSGVWSAITGFTDSAIRGIAFYKGYLLVIHQDGQIDATADDGSNWDLLFDDFGDSFSSHVPTHIAANDVLYVGRGNTVNCIYQKDGQTFDPIDGGTYDIGSDVGSDYPDLDLPSGTVVTSLSELGGNLLIGTRPNTASQDYLNSYLFVWDKSSSSYEQVLFKENGINYVISTNNLAYVQAGEEGEWYVTNGTTVEFLNKIPKGLLLNNATYNHPAACDILNNKIYFGVDDNSANSHLGIWSLDIRTGAISYEYIISTGESGVNEGLLIGSITNVNDELVISWYDEENSSYGVDSALSTGYANDYAYLISQYYQIAGSLDTLASKRFDLHLSKPCGSADSVKVYYRTAQNGSWTQITELTMGENDQNKSITKSLTNIKGIQFKIVLNGNAELLQFKMSV